MRVLVEPRNGFTPTGISAEESPSVLKNERCELLVASADPPQGSKVMYGPTYTQSQLSESDTVWNGPVAEPQHQRSLLSGIVG